MTEPTPPTPHGDVPREVPNLRPVDPGPIEEDTICARCGYNVRGLRADGLCPECGTPIARSLQGNLLRFADPAWLDKLRFGVALRLWNILVSVLAGIGGGVARGLGISVAPILAGIVAAILALVATWCITAPEPNIATSEDPMSLRRFIRACAVIGAIGGVANQILTSGSMPGAVPAGSMVLVAVLVVALAIIGIVATFGEFVYLRRFARRVPDNKLEDNTTVVMWGFCASTVAVTIAGAIAAVAYLPALRAAAPAGTKPALPGAPMAAMGVFLCVGGLGMLVFGIWNLVLLFQYHACFKQAAAESLQLMASANE